MTEKKRSGLSLGTRIFLIMALVLVLAVGSAVASILLVGRRIAANSVEQALKRSSVALGSSQQQYKRQLEQLSQTFADPYLTAYLAEGAGAADQGSILDALEQRQNALGFNFAVVLDPDGHVVARTDRRNSAGEDLSERPLVAEARKRGQPAVGVWREEGALYHAVAMPLVTQFEPVGYLVMGFTIDQNVARELAQMSGTEVAFLVSGPTGLTVLTSTLDAASSAQLPEAIARLGSLGNSGGNPESRRVELKLGGRPWAAQLVPLFEAAGKPVGATMALAAEDREQAPFSSLLTTVLVAGLLAFLAALALSYALSRRVLQPVVRLAGSAEAARSGDFGQKVAVERGDEVGRLARAFNELLADLREKRDMETYLTDLSRSLPDPGRAAPPVAPTRKSAATLVALELRRYARLAGDSAPEETVARLGQELRRATSLVASRQGRVVALLGHRLLAAFEGEGKSLRAVAAASEMLAGLTSATDAFDEAVAPLVVLTSGEVVSGSVALGETNTSALVGVAVQKLESLLREAAPGELLLSREVERELGSAIQESGVTPEPHRGVVTTLPFFALKGEAAARLAGVSLTTPTTAVRVPRVTPQPGDLGPGKLLGSRFEILAVLGSGGMGMVFKARDRELSDLVALKVLHRDAWVDPVQLERLKDELRLARKITHPNVLRTFDFGEVDGIHYISMEYVRGVTLRYMLDQSSRLPFSAGLRVGKQLLSGLAAAHAQGVLHRDIKPDNLILDATGNAKLMDFGIARPISRSGLGLTQEGWLVGTPQYMSPEQLQAQPVDARADLYSTGVLLYEVFTGRLPFLGTTPVEVAYQHIREAPPAPTSIAPDIPQHLEAILLRCLAKQPDDRYGSAVQLLDELEEMSL